MLRKKVIPGLVWALLAGIVIGHLAFQKGQGPAVRVVSIKPIGPGYMNGFLPLLVDGHTRDGCIPIVARSITRIILNRQGRMQLIKEPLTNVPLVAYDPRPSSDLMLRYPFDHRKIVPLFLPNGIPLVSDFGSVLVHDRQFTDENGVVRSPGYVEPWKLQTDSAPLACGLLELVKGVWRPSVVGSHNIPIEILPPVLATPENPAAAAVQPPTTRKGTP